MWRRTTETSDTSPGQFQVPLACKLPDRSNTTGKRYCSGMNTSFQTHNTCLRVSAQDFEVNLPFSLKPVFQYWDIHMAGGWCKQLCLRTTRIRNLWALLGSCGIISPLTVWRVLENVGCSLVKTYPSRFLDSKQNVFPKKKKNSLQRSFSIWSPRFALSLHRRVLEVTFALLNPPLPCATLYKCMHKRSSKQRQTAVLFQTCLPVRPMYSAKRWPTFILTQPVWMRPLYTHTHTGTSPRVLKVKRNSKLKLICYLLNGS